MRRFLIAGLLVTAFWTGRVRYVQSVTYQQAVQCEYQAMGRTFWLVFRGGTCPSQVEVE